MQKTTVCILLWLSASAFALASQDPAFILNGKRYQVQIDDADYYALTDPNSRISQAFAEMAGPGMQSLIILFDQASWKSITRGDAAGITQYITVAAQTETRGRAGEADLQALARQLETAFKSGDVPQLSGPAGQMGFKVGAYENQGLIRQEPHVIGSASATTYVDKSGNVVQEATTATLFFYLDSTIVNVIVARPSANEGDLTRVTEVAKRLEILPAQP